MAPLTHSKRKSQWSKSNFLWVSVSRRDKCVCVRVVFVGVGVGQGVWTGLAEWRGRVREYIIVASRRLRTARRGSLISVSAARCLRCRATL